MAFIPGCSLIAPGELSNTLMPRSPAPEDLTEVVWVAAQAAKILEVLQVILKGGQVKTRRETKKLVIVFLE